MPHGWMEGRTQLPRQQRSAKSRQETGHQSQNRSVQNSGRETEPSRVGGIGQGPILGLLGKWRREQDVTSGTGEGQGVELMFKRNLVP